jgi:UDP-N-acetylmuramate dehydrogenase
MCPLKNAMPLQNKPSEIMENLSWEPFLAVRAELETTIVHDFGIPILANEPGSRHVTFKTGGPMGILALPENSDSISRIRNLCSSRSIPTLVLGKGSNTLIRDGGFPGIVIKLAENFARIEILDRYVTALAGVTLHDLAMATAVKGLKGLEFSVDIPGTVGGGLFMNAGMYDETIGALLTTVTVLSAETAQLVEVPRTECDFSYRSSRFQRSAELVIQATFELQPHDSAVLLHRIATITAERKQKFPLDFPNAGSIFKRPPGHYAGALIEQAGLKGRTCGGAMVSPKHSNFIVNTGGATVADIETLIEEIKDVVWNRFAVQLEPEVRIFGLHKDSRV